MTLEQVVSGLDVRIALMQRWVKDSLPSLNSQIESQQKLPEALISVFYPQVKELLADNLSQVSRWEARQLIQLLGFGASSIEKHYQEAHFPPGAGLAQLPGLADLLVDLARIACHTPRDSHYTYWKWNSSDHPLTFTGDPQEMFFNRVVNLTDRLHTISCDALRPICQGNLAAVSPDAVEAIQLVTRNTQELATWFRAFMSKDASGKRQMEPMFFMTRMRTYLPSYPIHDIEWGGVNAANVAAQMQIDYLIGTVNPEYNHTVQDRFRYLTEEDRKVLSSDMELPTLGETLLTQLRLCSEQIMVVNRQELTHYLNDQTEMIRRVLGAYADLFTSAATLTSMHWALIQNYLVKPAAQLSHEDRSVMAVQPDAGTGGKSHDETKAIMQMRREHRVMKKLVEAINA